MAVSTGSVSDRVSGHRIAGIAKTMTRSLVLPVLTLSLKSSIILRIIPSKNLALAKAVWCTIRAFLSTPRKLDCGHPFDSKRTHSSQFLTVSQEDQEDGKNRL